MIRFLLLASLAAAPLSMAEDSAKNDAPPLIPMRDFFRNPVAAAYQVSPSGDYISWMAPWESRLNVFVQPVDGSAEPRRLTSATKRDIGGYFWSAKDQIVYLQDDGGDENFHLYAVNADGSGQKDLTPFPEVRVGVVDDLRDDEDGARCKHSGAYDTFPGCEHLCAAVQWPHADCGFS